MTYFDHDKSEKIEENYIFKWKDIKKITFVFDTLSCPCPICRKALKKLTEKENKK